MKIHFISDITLETLAKKQFLNSSHIYSFEFVEDLVSHLSQFDRFANYDILYIHFDADFKNYSDIYLGYVLKQIHNLSERTTQTILCSNLIGKGWSTQGLHEMISSIVRHSFVSNEALMHLQNKKNFFFFDVQSIIYDLGRSNIYNFKLGHLYQMPYTKSFLDKFSIKFEEYVKKLASPDKKVIVLDCDNTLWKGIIGEDGVDQIRCDLNHDGILYYHFQDFIKTRKELGFILCICSKNNEEDVRFAFKTKKMPLQWDDFVIRKINWENKDKNIREIAEELNLGIDSFIFVDDSDFELNLVREHLPEVKLLKMTDDYNNFLNLRSDLAFSKKSITAEDKVKSKMYYDESRRKQLQDQSNNIGDYIKSLDIILDIRKNDENDLNRVSQLTEKTNQFNFNKKYYSVEQLRANMHKQEQCLYTLRVSDRFGDYGLVGVILVNLKQQYVTIENFILSCRVLGRNIEDEFWNYVSNDVYEHNGKAISKISFNKTEKNIPAQNFFNKINNQTT